ncbi:hypothetical protein RHGRI_014116 [Rhododendron griersonianum]|uniref:Uncharacterized protein n=1 Tax=Rhododendron griersonianum TaxID=479676 RepID=A0AAV6K8H2_9ERIC|nr:hypothetical protein RHGRI_014116 [Rhododendron griersonianum]
MVIERESFDFFRWDSKLYVRNGQNSTTPALIHVPQKTFKFFMVITNSLLAYVEMRISYLQTMVGKFQPPYAGAKETVDYAMTELAILVKSQNIDSSNFLRYSSLVLTNVTSLGKANLLASTTFSPNTSKSISTTGMTDVRKTVQKHSLLYLQMLQIRKARPQSTMQAPPPSQKWILQQ